MNRFLNKQEDADLYLWNLIDENSPQPTMENPVCQLTTAEQWDQPCFESVLEDIKRKKHFHRKQWEIVYCINALKKYDKLKNGSVGLGFACGKEFLPSYFASKGCKITASDQCIENSGNWAKTNQHSNSLQDLFYQNYVKREYFEKNVSFRNIDMNDIPEDLFDSVDFCWSICAMEHIGGIKKGADFLRNSLKCLKVGGVAIHTTEFNLSSNEETFDLKNNAAFRHRDVVELLDSLPDNFEYQTNFQIGENPLNFFINKERRLTEPHLKIVTLNFILTCFGFIIQRVK